MRKIFTPFVLTYILFVFIVKVIKVKWQVFVIAKQNQNKNYQKKRIDFIQQYKSENGAANISAKNDDSHVFRKQTKRQNKLTLRQFNQVIAINIVDNYADVEGSATYYDFAQACLEKGFMPAVCPELRSITVGGAISGVGVESSSFRYGLVHETVLELDVLLPDGNVVTCTPDNNHRDLFYGIPNSYGTLGYVLRARVKIIKAKPYVKLKYQKFYDFETYFEALYSALKGNIYDFIDGAFIDNKFFIMVLGEFADHANQVSNYLSKEVYFQAIQKKEHDTLTIHDYLWRWDSDMFWTTQMGGLPKMINHRWFRKLFGKVMMRSDRLMMLRPTLEKLRKLGFDKPPENFRYEHLVQDVGVNIKHCADFMRWYDETINVYPIWICPIMHHAKNGTYPLFDFKGVFCDIGFYGEKLSSQKDPWHYNKLIESKLLEMGAIKALYSDNKFSKDQFWQMFDRDAYLQLKTKYDPQQLYPSLFEKSVR